MSAVSCQGRVSAYFWVNDKMMKNTTYPRRSPANAPGDANLVIGMAFLILLILGFLVYVYILD